MPHSPIPLDTTLNLSRFKYLPELDNPGEYKLFRISEKPLKTIIPAIFEVISQISIEDCFLSIRTDRAFEGLEDGDVAGVVTCWIERRDGLSSLIQWSRYFTLLRRLADLTGVEEVVTSALFLDKPGGVPKIHMFHYVASEHEVRFCLSHVSSEPYDDWTPLG